MAQTEIQREVKKLQARIDELQKKAKLGKITKAQAELEIKSLQWTVDNLTAQHKLGIDLKAKGSRIKELDGEILDLEKKQKAIKASKPAPKPQPPKPKAPKSEIQREVKKLDKEIDKIQQKAKLGKITKAEAQAELKAVGSDVNNLMEQEKLQRSLLSKEARLKALDDEIIGLDKDLETLEKLKKSKVQDPLFEDLKKKYVAPTPQTAMNEVKYADELAEELKKGGLRLKKQLPKVAQEIMDKPNYTLLELRDAIADELIKESGKMYKPMTQFLESSLGTQFDGLAKADFGVVYGSADDIVPKIVLHGAKEATEYSGTLSKFVLKQVDDTQSSSPYLFTRHVESGACKWCHQQVSVYETTRQFFRHHNCRCMKIRK